MRHIINTIPNNIKINLQNIPKYTVPSSTNSKIEIKGVDKLNIGSSNIQSSYNTESYDFDTQMQPSVTTIDQLSQMDTILTSSIEELQNEIDTLESSSSSSWGIWDRPSATTSVSSNTVNTEKIKQLKDELATLKQLQNQIKTELELSPYNDIVNSEEFKKFIENYDCENWGYDSDDLMSKGFDVNLYYQSHLKAFSDSNDIYAVDHIDQLDQYAIFELMNKGHEDVNIEAIQAMGNASLMNGISPDGEMYSNPANNYYFMTEDQINMYHYLFQKEGKQSAEHYISLIQDEINMKAGAYYAEKFIQTLDLSNSDIAEETILDHFKVSGKGLTDGIDTFFTGLNNAIIANEQLESSDYEKMYILQYLKENSNLLDENYEFSQAMGNMIPAMTVSAVVSCVGTPAAGSMVGSSLMGLSAEGNAYRQAKIEGHDELSSRTYGVLIGASEATLGYFLGRIPGISKYSGFTIKNLFMEGAEEFSQEWLDAGFQAVILGNDVDWSEVPENAIKSFVMGVMMAGITNGGQSIASFTINGKQMSINVADTLAYMEQNPNTDIMEAIQTVNNDIEILQNTMSETTDSISIENATNNPVIRQQRVEQIDSVISNINSMKLEVDQAIQSGQPLSENYYQYLSQLPTRIQTVISEADISQVELKDSLEYAVTEIEKMKLDVMNNDMAANSLLNNLFESVDENNADGQLFIRKLQELNADNQLLITTSKDTGEACYNSDFDYVSIGEKYIEYENSTVLAHELGHLLHRQILDSTIPSNFDEIVTNARTVATENGKLREVSQVYRLMVDSANEQAQNSVTMTMKEKVEEIISLQRYFIEQGIKPTTAIKMAKEQIYASRISENYDRIINSGNETEFSPELADIIDAVYEGKKQDTNGRFFALTRGHGSEYFSTVDAQFSEMIADFSALKVTGKEHDLQLIKDMFGEDFYNMLDETYYAMVK